MTTNPTPTTHAAKAEAARQAARSSGLGSPAAITPAILLIIATLIAELIWPRCRHPRWPRPAYSSLLDAIAATAAFLLAIGIALAAVVAVVITLRLAFQLLGALP